MNVYTIRRPGARDFLCQVVAADAKRALAVGRSMFRLPRGTTATAIRQWQDPNRAPWLKLESK